MKTFQILALFFMGVIASPQIYAQDDPYADSPLNKWVGNWEITYTKSEPDGLIGKPNFPEKASVEVIPTPDGRGVLWTSRTLEDGIEQVSTVCIFYIPAKNQSFGISAFGKGWASYPEEGIEEIPQSSFDDQTKYDVRQTWIDNDQVNTEATLTIGEQPTIKLWGIFRRLE